MPSVGSVRRIGPPTRMVRIAIDWPEPVTRLVHLNGPPGIGKSTLSAMLSDRHPGTLNLDIDKLSHLVGGWQDRSVRVLEVLRPDALAMAAAHLRGGRDVVVPQYLSDLGEIAAFEAVAREEGADFCEVLLIDSRERSIARYDDRARRESDPWIQHSRRVVDEQGGSAFLGHLHDALGRVIQLRPAAVIDSEPGRIEDTYALLVAALNSSSDRAP